MLIKEDRAHCAADGRQPQLYLNFHVCSISGLRAFDSERTCGYHAKMESDIVNLSRRQLIGGSDARIIMGSDEAALLRLWQEKRGEIDPEDLSDNLIVQLGLVTEDLNRRWFELNTGQIITDRQRRLV